MTYIASDLLTYKINADLRHTCTLAPALCAGHITVWEPFAALLLPYSMHL